MDAPPVASVVCWRWTPPPGYRSTFPAESVNDLARMVRKHYQRPHRFLCVTDDTTGIDPRLVEAIQPWDDYASVPPPQGGKNPSCYRRLRMFHPDIASVFGPRFVSLDLDTVIVKDLTPVWDRPEPIVLWGDTNPTTYYNGSMVLLTAGARPGVWTDFDPATSPDLAKAAKQFGSDQAWISYRLGPDEPIWTTADGVYSYRNHIAKAGSLPADARIVFFHGREDPWLPHMRGIEWIAHAYC